MKKWLTSLFVLATVTGGVSAGMPLHSGRMDGQMKCCEKAKGKEGSTQANAARLCCAVNCSDPVPTSSGASFNFAPSNIEILKPVAERISSLFRKEKAERCMSLQYSRKILLRIFHPKYIQNSSFLI